MIVDIECPRCNHKFKIELLKLQKIIDSLTKENCKLKKELQDQSNPFWNLLKK